MAKSSVTIRFAETTSEVLEDQAAKLGLSIPRLCRRIVFDWCHHVQYGAPDEEDFPLWWSDAPPADQLPYALLAWLRSPQIHVSFSSGDDVQQLRDECDRLREDVQRLEGLLDRSQRLYAQECAINMSLQDQLRSLGVKVRR